MGLGLLAHLLFCDECREPASTDGREPRPVLALRRYVCTFDHSELTGRELTYPTGGQSGQGNKTGFANFDLAYCELC
jgi:hypothetical protein